MAPLYGQAERIINPPDVGWRELLLSRYVGAMPANTLYDRACVVVVVIEEITTSLPPVEELHGHFEYSPDPPLYTKRQLAGTVDPRSRELRLRESRASLDMEPECYLGYLSENGRLMTLRARWRDGTCSEPFYLGHEDTMASLIPDEEI